MKARTEAKVVVRLEAGYCLVEEQNLVAVDGSDWNAADCLADDRSDDSFAGPSDAVNWSDSEAAAVDDWTGCSDAAADGQEDDENVADFELADD